LARILGEPGSSEAADLPLLLIGSDDVPKTLFRARRADSADQARVFLSNPEKELTAPPPSIAKSGRMNPAGISVFYAAMSEEVAIAEVRPTVGGIVAVASFTANRPLRVLDLTQLHDIGFAGSVFSPSYSDRVAGAKFLRGFHRLIAQPVQPQDEPLEYLPTQAVAEYVRHVLGFDGILYASTQVGALAEGFWYEEDLPVVSVEKCNIVVFGRTTRDYDSDPWDPPRIRGLHTEYPLVYQVGSAHGILVRSVNYGHYRIDLSDERGMDSGPACPDF
jgi:hypothetical protein